MSAAGSPCCGSPSSASPALVSWNLFLTLSFNSHVMIVTHTPTTNVFLKELVGVKLLFYASWFVYFIIFYFIFYFIFFVRRAAERHGARCWLAPRGCCFSVNYQRFNSSTTPSNLRDRKPDIYSLSRSLRENAPRKALVRLRTCVWVAVKTHALEVGQSTCMSAVKIKKRREAGGERQRRLRLSHAVVNNSHWILFYFFASATIRISPR